MRLAMPVMGISVILGVIFVLAGKLL